MRSPIGWFGGKGKMIKKLLPLIPEHHIYVEVFGGAASLLFAKKPSNVEVYNDIDQDLVHFFRVLRDEEKFHQFAKKANLTLYSRAEYTFCHNTWQDAEDEVERAYRWWVVARQSFAGQFGSSWGYSVTESRCGMSKDVSGFLSAVELLPQAHNRIRRVQIECDDFRKVISTYDTPKTFFYLDPPYLPATRQAGGYQYEMDRNDHYELVELCLQAKGNILLSGYASEIYEPLEAAGWQRRDFQTVCHAAGHTRGTGILGEGSARRMQPRTETVWISVNYDPDGQLKLF